MVEQWKILLILGALCECFWIIEAASTSAGRYSRRLQKTHEYLPPLTLDYDERPHHSHSSLGSKHHSIHAITNNAADSFQTTPQISSKKTNSRNVYQKTYNSYAPPASGAAPFQYSAPQASNLVPLPALLPKSLVQQLSNSATAPLQQQQQPQHYLSSDELAPAPMLMVEEPVASFLTPTQNRTLQAARILANTLLEASGEAPLEEPTSLNALNSYGFPPQQQQQQPPSLNATDVLIVKSQKNAYIIPAPLAKDVRQPQKARALYQMRDQFEKAYTINQFIFIIKPERINFLNKLV